ncbi:MAG: hypothetical protein CM15mP53_06840 [Ectothiorhodospiraceae bacterium]|nr:MAG: hypothetical protein CM15mP53_06840 [Ectothiorhodospiraceae bacterium]
MKKNYFTSQSHIDNYLKKQTEMTDRKLQKNSLGEALNMQLPTKERILIMKVEH